MPPKQAKSGYDVIVAGGGPAGCAMAALLGRGGLTVACIDRDDPKESVKESYDARTTAISFGSRAILEKAGAWNGLESHACAIEDIKITDSGAPTLLRFLSEDVDSEAFGWVIENRYLRAKLFAALDHPNIDHIAPAAIADYAVDDDGVDVILADGKTLRAKLVIGADGRNSFTRDWMGIGTRGWKYNQRAIVCIVSHENPHNNIAVEDFRGEGPFAILPMLNDANGNHRSALVWTEHGPEKSSMLRWDDATFNAALRERFPPEYGAVKMAGPRKAFPLSLAHAHSYIGPRMALVADAAHGIHPIAGQGLNIGLRDIAALAEILKGADDPGDAALLQSYERARRPDNMAMAAATDALNKLFSNNSKSLRILRRAGLHAVERIPAAKRFFMRYAMGAGGLAAPVKTKKS